MSPSLRKVRFSCFPHAMQLLACADTLRRQWRFPLNFLQTVSTFAESNSSVRHAQSTAIGTNDSFFTNTGYITTKHGNHNNSLFPKAMTTAKQKNRSADVADVNSPKVNNNDDWWLILIVVTSSVVLILAVVFVALVFRLKRINGVWFKGIRFVYFLSSL